MIGLKANLFDGSYHDVDSSEMAFKMAASIAYKEGMKLAAPVLMEPVMALSVYVPDSMVGDIMGDLNKRRGRVLGINPDENKHGSTIIEAEAPQAELLEYTVALRSMTQGRGRYDMKFVRYEEVPAPVAERKSLPKIKPILKNKYALLGPKQPGAGQYDRLPAAFYYTVLGGQGNHSSKCAIRPATAIAAQTGSPI